MLEKVILLPQEKNAKIVNCRDSKEFWEIILTPPVWYEVGQFYAFEETHPGIPLIADLSDPGIMQWFSDFFKYHAAWFEREELINALTGFAGSERSRMNKILKDVIEAVFDAVNEAGDGRAESFLTTLLYKDFIRKEDVTFCIREVRKRRLYRMIPLLLLKENGEIPVYTDRLKSVKK